MLACSDQERSATPVIDAPAGKLQGDTVNGIHRFLGIPYAEPPFGELRWRAPVPRPRWAGVLAATRYGAICPQTSGGPRPGSPDRGEDCLNLNVWTPDPTTKGMPVMVWVHDGGQVSGSGADNDGTHFAEEGVVLVTCNRQLGAKGFLYLEELFGDDFGPGNLGIQDLIEVLNWVARNIRHFGGDPADAAHAGLGLELDYLIGCCRDELNLFDALLSGMIEPRARHMAETAGLPWHEVVCGYRAARPNLDDAERFNAIVGDLWFRVPAVRLAQGHAAPSART